MASHYQEPFFKGQDYLFGKELPNDVSHISQHLLSQWAAKKFMLCQLHSLQATMKATLINLCRDSFMPFVATTLQITDQRKHASLCALCLCQMMCHLRKGERKMHSAINPEFNSKEPVEW